MNWPSLKFPPINLWSLPYFKKPECPDNHANWLYEYSMKRKTCYSCGKELPITNDMPVHTR